MTTKSMRRRLDRLRLRTTASVDMIEANSRRAAARLAIVERELAELLKAPIARTSAAVLLERLGRVHGLDREAHRLHRAMRTAAEVAADDERQRIERARLAALPTDELARSYYERLSVPEKPSPRSRLQDAALAAASLPELVQLCAEACRRR